MAAFGDADRRLISAHLEDLVGSAAMGGPSTLASRLIRFAVEEELAGRGADIHEKLVGEAALGRRPGYDTKLDRIASVIKAKLVAERLPAYYNSDGARQRVRFGLATKGFRAQIEILPERLSRTAALRYLRGLRAYDERSPAGLHVAAQELEAGLDEAGGHAESFALLADLYATLANFGSDPRLVMPLAETYSRQAIALDPRSWRGHVALASVIASVHHDWESVERHLEIALEVNAAETRAHPWYTALLVARGRAAEAAAEMEQIVYERIDLLRVPIVRADLALMLMAAGQLEQAEHVATELLADGASSLFFHLHAGLVCAAQHRFQDAIDHMQVARQHPGGLALVPSWEAFCHGRLGNQSEAERLRREVEGGSGWISCFFRSAAAVGVGQFEEAIALLEQGLRDGEPLLLWAGSWPFYEPLRQNPAFRALLNRNGLRTNTN
jgi:hypothetical protein